MDFYQRNKKNDKWLQKYGCATISTLYRFSLWFPEIFKIKFSTNDWFEIYKMKKIFNKNMDIVWWRLQNLFPVKLESAHIYNREIGKHYDLKHVKDDSIISVDGQKVVGYQSHFMPVINKTKDNIVAWDTYFKDVVDIRKRYGAGKKNLEEMVYTILNFRKE